MDLILKILRFVTVGSPDGKQIAIRLVAVAAIIIIVVIWGINYRSQTPPSGIRGDTSPTLAPLTEAGTLVIGEAVTGSLVEGERHTWAFEGQQGQRVNIRVRGDWDSTIELLPPNGSQSIGGDFNSGGDWQAFLCSYRLPMTGTFTTVVSGYLGLPDQNFGDYTLSIEEETYIEERPVAYGETVEDRLTTCDGDFYTIAVEEGDTLQVTLTPESGADMFVRLLPSRTNGDLIAISQTIVGEDGKTQDIVAVNILATTTFFIQVDAPVNAPEADYTLTVGRYEGATQEATAETTSEATAAS